MSDCQEECGRGKGREKVIMRTLNHKDDILRLAGGKFVALPGVGELGAAFPASAAHVR